MAKLEEENTELTVQINQAETAKLDDKLNSEAKLTDM